MLNRIPTGRRRTAAAALGMFSAVVSTFSIGLALADAIPASTPPWASGVIALGLAAANAFALTLLSTPPASMEPERLAIGGFLIAAPAILTGFAWAPAGSATAIALLFLTGGLLIVAGIGWWAWQPEAVSNAGSLAGESEAIAEATVSGPVSLAAVEPSPLEATTPVDAEVPTPRGDVLQSMTRRQDGDSETIELVTQIAFAAGERHVSLHLPLSPPLAGTPEVECEPLDEAELELHVGAAFPYGIRIDARRRPPCDQPLTASVGIQLHSNRVRRAA